MKKANTVKSYYTATNLEKLRHYYYAALSLFDTDRKYHALSVSAANSKMGAVASVSLPPFLTCPACCKCTCGVKCYAAKLALLRPVVAAAWSRNLALLQRDPVSYWQQVDSAIKAVRFFRFHVSGDIVNAAYFENMVNAARNNPHAEILAFTKQYSIVNNWIAANGGSASAIPSNLHILFSGWTNLQPVNLYNLPETNVYTCDADFDDNWLTCGGNCFNCACRGVGCWQARPGDTIAFRMH